MNIETIKSVLSELEPLLEKEKEVLTETLARIAKANEDSEAEDFILDRGLPKAIYCSEDLLITLRNIFGRYCKVISPSYYNKPGITLVYVNEEERAWHHMYKAIPLKYELV